MKGILKKSLKIIIDDQEWFQVKQEIVVGEDEVEESRGREPQNLTRNRFWAGN